MGRIHRRAFHVLAEAVDNGAHDRFLHEQRRRRRLAAEHGERARSVGRRIEGGDALVAHGRLVGDAQPLHAIDTVAGEGVVLLVVGDEVIAPLGVDEAHRRLTVDAAVALGSRLFVHVVLHVAEGHLAAAPDGLVQRVHVMEHRLVLHLDAAFHVHVLGKRGGLVAGAQRRQPFGEAMGHTNREEARGLHGVGEQHELGGGEGARDEGVADRVRGKLRDVETEVAKGVQVAVHRFALGLDARLSQPGDDFGAGEAVTLVGALVEHLGEVEQLQFLALARHRAPLSPRSPTLADRLRNRGR